MTTRFKESAGTDRWEEKKKRPTFQFDDVPSDYDPLSLKPGDFVDDRFKIIERIKVKSGEADIYRCTDEQTGKPAVVKFYRQRFQPKQKVIDGLLKLHSEGIVSIISYGIWTGRFYEAMEYCSGGMLSNYLPLNAPAIRSILPPLLNGLQYLHTVGDNGIIHRDIKPDNIYFRSPNMQGLVLGDFGISSIMDSDSHTHRTSSPFWTIDYTAPELFADKVHKESDYYSLGITIIHSFFGASPFENYKTREAIAAAHMAGNVPRRDELPDELRILVKGLTQLKPSNRWQYRQVMQWLKGEQILTDKGHPWKEDLYGGKETPYPNYPDAKTPEELAAVLDKFDSKNDLFRGRISNWVFNNFSNAAMAKKIEYIEENFASRRDLGIIKLAFILDPTAPLKIYVDSVKTISDLIEVVKKGHHVDFLKTALYDEHIECWIEETQDIEGEGKKSKLLQSIAAIRQRFNGSKDLGLFTLLYTLSPQTPLVVDSARNISIQRPEEIESAIAKHPGSLDRFTTLLFDRYLEEWLRISFSGDAVRKSSADFLESTRSIYSSDRALATWVMRWHFSPSLGFPFYKQTAKTPKELARLIDKDKESWAEGNKLLQNGWIKAWLVTSGQIQAAQFDQLNVLSGTWETKLEALLHLLDSKELAKPKPVASQTRIDMGNISTEGEKTSSITIHNGGRGHLSGSIVLVGSGSGIAMESKSIEGNPVTVTVTARALGLPAGSRQLMTINVNTNGGTLQIPVNFTVTAPVFRMIARSLGYGTLFALFLGGYRYVIGAMSGFKGTMLPYISSGDQLESVNGGGVAFLSCIFFGVMLTFLYYAISLRRAAVAGSAGATTSAGRSSSVYPRDYYSNSTEPRTNRHEYVSGVCRKCGVAQGLVDQFGVSPYCQG